MKMKHTNRILAMLLALCMIVTGIPMTVVADTTVADTASVDATDEDLTAALTEAKTYIDALTIDNTSNDPETVVSNFGTHFTWDNEERENNSKVSYLYDWSYYNGVVFEGLEYAYEVTDEEEYKDYVIEYMSSLIKSDGTWNTCSNNFSKECAGYVNDHGADCYKTASLLLDAYEMTNDSRYLTMAATLYADLDAAANSYSLSNAGNNYRHTWASDPDPDLWLDGLYMILPFRAEYAKYIGDVDELDLIVDRMQWVSNNMYDESKGLFYHAADSASSNSGTYWLRSIGWYAAAIVDIMDSMEGENLEAMKAQLVKLVEGMKAVQNSSNGMWLNDMAASESATNPYETSGTALVCYAVMKAVNEGWLDESYADMALLAFKGICEEKLMGDKLTDICYKGTPGSSNSTFNDNEGKGVGSFIMLYAEVLEYVNAEEETPEPTVTPEAAVTPSQEPDVIPEEVTDGTTNLVISGSGSTAVEVVDKTSDETVKTALESVASKFMAYDITLTGYVEGTEATVSMPIPDGYNKEKFAVYYIPEDGSAIEKMDGRVVDTNYEFTTTHFSTYAGVELLDESENSVSAIGNLVGGIVYTLDTNGVTANKNYLIVNTGGNGTGYALTNNSGSAGSTQVNISNDTITVADDTNIAWQFSGTTSGTVGNNGRYVYPNNGSLSLNTSGTNDLTISDQNNGAYRIYRYSNRYYYYVIYDIGKWTGSRNRQSGSVGSVYLYECTSSSSGEEVVFTITPGSVTLAPKDTKALTGTVIVAGETVDISNCTVEWASSDGNKAMVSNGTVTGVADGTTNITATLSAVDGTALQENIVLTIPVTVQSKTVISGKLTGNDPVTTIQNVEPDFSGIKLEVTYDDGTTGTITVDNGLVIEGYDITTIGYSYATISYAGKEYGTVRVTVEGNPYEGLEEATEYPEYPADGAVRIDKTATEIDFENTGVVQVELDVAGISVKPAVDVILVTDLSNSMAWSAGSRTDAASHEATKIYDLQQSVASFADIFLAVDEEGNATENTMSLVTFGGYDVDYTNKVYTDYADPTRTLLLGSSDAGDVKSTINDIRVLADDALNIGTSTTGYYLSFDGGATYGENYGNTNYDHAFMQTAKAITELKAAYKTENGTEYDESGRQIYVLFMTDGAPSNYDGVYYNYKTGDRADVNCTWVNASGEKVTYTMGNNRAQYQAGPWYQYIAGGTYNATTDTIPGNPLYWADQVYNTESVANIYNIGFDLDNGGFSSMTFTLADDRPLSKVLEKLVTGQTLEVFSADDEEGLSQIYANLATKIRYAGTSANVSDIVDSQFTLQTTQTTGTEESSVHGNLGFKPTITITAYDLWTKEETTDTKLIGTRKTNEDGSYVCNVTETISFNDDGTKAYSDIVGNGTKNIMSTAADGTVTIEAHYFTYIKTPEGVESFKWNIGNITDQEIALSYYAYLTGSLEGERPKGLYYTNEEATLEYIDINGDHATQIFPVPAVAWGGASTAYEFYLVNENGEPCDRAGNVIPFANRIIITGPYYEELYLNQEDEEYAKEIVAAYVLPAGYTLYDDTAKYTVVTASGTIEGSLTISDPATDKEQTTILVSATTPSYIQSRVAFGVLYNEIPTEAEFELTPDEVVIDYGKPIIIDITNGHLEEGYEASLVGFSRYYDTVDLKTKFSSTSAINNYKAAYGTFSVEDETDCKVRYTPTAMLDDVEMIFCVIKMSNATTNDVYYMADWLTVIPATNVYYETDFAGGVFDLATTGEAWGPATVNGDNVADGPQDDGTIGVFQTYGYDDSYENDKYLSNGSSWKVEGQGIKLNDTITSYTEAKFSFTGTGFDLISRTGELQGAIRVSIYTDEARTTANRVKVATVLNKSETKLELYQIPVISIEGLEHDTYYVTIGVNSAYTDEAIPELSRGGEFYFDAIRVFDPVDVSDGLASTGNALTAYEAYIEDGEAHQNIQEVRNNLIDADTYNAADAKDINGIVYVDKGTDGVDVSTYSQIGPNNEVYLKKGNGIAFAIHMNDVPASIDVGAKSANGETVQFNATLSSDANRTSVNQIEKTIASSSSQYIDLAQGKELTSYITKDADGGYVAYVFITNTGTGILSITDIKVAYDTKPVMPEALFMSSARVLSFARACMEEPIVEEPNYDILSAEFTKTSGRILKTATMTVVTTQDVTELKVTNKFGWQIHVNSTYKDQEDGNRVWTLKMLPILLGEQTYTIAGCGAEGSLGESATASINIRLF